MTTAIPAEVRSTLHQDLHDLSQPVTRLQWRLELGKQGGESELRETLEGALADTVELVDWIRRVRSRMEEQEATA